MNEEERKQARKGLILGVAGLMQAFSPAQEPSITFDRAEAFADEAEKRGYDVASIAAGGLLP